MTTVWLERSRRMAALALLAVLLAGPVAAAEQAVAEHHPDEEWPVAPVVIDGRTLFKVRGLSSLPADERARRIVDRVVAFARDGSLPPSLVRVAEADGASAIVAGERRLMTVTEADARTEGADRALVAQAYRDAIERAVTDWREARAPEHLLPRILSTLAATVGLVLALLALRWPLRWLDAALARRFGTRVHDVGIQSFRILRAEQIWRFVGALLRVATWLFALALAYFYLYFVLSLYPATRNTAARLLELVMEPLHALAAGMLAALPKVLFLVVLVIVTRVALRLLRTFFASVESGAVKFANFEAEWAPPTYRLVRLVVIFFALVVAYPYIPGSGSEAFKGVSLFVGVLFSLGSTSVIANLVAGYSMTYRRAFRVGDLVKIGDVLGTVSHARLQVTHLRTAKNEEVLIPNSTILTSNVTNYTTLAKQHGLILHTRVGIGYETPWRQVEAMLVMAAERTPGVVKEPAPFVLQRELGDFAVVYELNAYTDDPTGLLRKYADLHRNVLDVFNEYGIQIMTPAYEGDPAEPKVVPKDRWHVAPAASAAAAGRGADEPPQPPAGAPA